MALSIFTAPFTSYSQSWPIEWQKCFGGTLKDECSSIQPTPDGGYIAIGTTSSTNGDVTGIHSIYDYWVIKINSSGALQWQKCLGGSDMENGKGIKPTVSGGYICSGTASSYDGDVSGLHGTGIDLWTVNLDSAGNIIWQKCLGGTLAEYNNNIIQADVNQFVSVSSTNSNDGDVNFSTYGSHDYWFVIQDSTGAIAWQQHYGGTGYEKPYDIIQTIDGGYLFSGTTHSNDIDVSGNNGFFDSWIVKVNSIGALQWQKCLGGTNTEQSFGVMQTSDGGYIITNQTNSNDGDVSGNHGDNDAWIVKLDSNGTIMWQKCYGGSGFDGLYDVTKAPDGNPVFIGSTYSNDGDVSGNHDTTGTHADLWVVKIDNVGTIIWQKCFGGSNDEAGSGSVSIETASDGGYIIGTYSYSNDGDVSGNHGGGDYWIIKTVPDTITNISKIDKGFENLKIYPNPTNGIISLDLGKKMVGEYDLSIQSVLGKQIFSGKIMNAKTDIQIPFRSDGIYIAILHDKEKKIVARQKIIYTR